jgi:dipeptidase D
LAAFFGGSARNALPREAWAVVGCRPDQEPRLREEMAAYRALLAEELADRDPGVGLSLTPAAAAPVISAADQAALLGALQAAPFGVRTMSASVVGVVETSNNLGIVTLADGAFAANLMVRSLRDSATETLAAEIVSLFELAGCQAAVGGHYPGWTPNPHSQLLSLCLDVYHREFGRPATTQVIHAGLECGIIGAKYPGLDTISFGPTIRGAHAPGERVEIATVGTCWHLLRALLAAL